MHNYSHIRFLTILGGYGTLEELLEVITYAQLGIHRKPVRIICRISLHVLSRAEGLTGRNLLISLDKGMVCRFPSLLRP